MEPFEKIEMLKFGSHLKDLNCLAAPFLLTVTVQVQNRFKRLYFGLDYLSDLAKGAEAMVVLLHTCS